MDFKDMNWKTDQSAQINLTLATGMMIVSFVAAPLVAYYSAQSSTNMRMSEIDKRVGITETQVINLDKRLENIERKLDQLLLKSGVKP